MEKPERFIDLDRLEFLVTYACSSDCDHCSVRSAGKQRMPPHMDPGKALGAIDQACDLFGIRSLMTFGGEPLLFPEFTCALLSRAAERGIGDRQVITNGSWSKDRARIDEIVAMLEESGPTSILVSIDCFHEKHLDYSIVEHSLGRLREGARSELLLHPVWVGGKDAGNAYNARTKELLARFGTYGIPESEGNVLFPAGRALERLPDCLPPKTKAFSGSCADQPYSNPPNAVRSLCLEPDGSVVACEAIGNVNVQSIADIVSEYDFRNDPVRRAMAEGGIAAVLSLARQRGISMAEDGYYSLCELCKDVSSKLKRRGSRSA